MSELRKHFALKGAQTAVVLLAFAFCWVGSSVQAQTITVYFECISPHLSEENIATGEEQLRLDVTHHLDDPTIATFKFYNIGTQDCSISDIYIDDGQLCDLLNIIDYDDPYIGNPDGCTEVDFSIGAAPGSLPDGQHADPPFVATKQFNMDSDPPTQPWGINQAEYPGEWLIAVYSVSQGTDVYDIEQEILNGDLRVGYHVQGFSDGDSGSFVNTPEPASGLLLGLGILIFLKKRKNKP